MHVVVMAGYIVDVSGLGAAVLLDAFVVGSCGWRPGGLPGPHGVLAVVVFRLLAVSVGLRDGCLSARFDVRLLFEVSLAG